MMSKIKYRAIIVDDEEGARKVLNKLLLKFCPEIEIVALCNDVISAKTKIEELSPDLVFLDIEMPNYAGYEIVNFFDEIDFEIIFVTAYDNYAIKAFEISAIDYLLKPVEVIKLQAAIKKFMNNYELKKTKRDYHLLKENLTDNNLKKLILRKNNGLIVTPVNDIIAIQAQQAYCTILTQKDTFTTSKNLKYYQSLLENNSNFFRTHKSWIINKDYLIKFSKTTMDIKLDNNITAKLSKYKSIDFESFLLK